MWLHAVLDLPDSDHASGTAFWGGVLGWPAGPSWPGHPELQSFEPADGSAYVHAQRVQGAPRVHLDLDPQAPDAAEDLVERAVGLGAQPVAAQDRWITLTSPGGLPFCVLTASEPRRTPSPAAWPDGHRSRMVQVCVDSPGSAHEREVAFWRAVLPGRWFPSGDAEFAGKWHAEGSPLQLLFQRLDEPDGAVRAHLDHGTDDVASEVDRVRALGATDVADGRGWHVLRDPAGMTFCVTENSPARTRVRDLG